MTKKILAITIMMLMLICTQVFASTIIIVPSGTSDDADLIQNTLDGLQNGDTLILNGSFVFGQTIYLPSNFTWILNGSLTLTANADLDEAGWVAPGIDATRRTGITEYAGGATNIEMTGGTYYGNSANYTQSMRFINFVSVTNSNFHDFTVREVTDDCFTFGPGCNNNQCRNIIGSWSLTGNGLTDKGDHNDWYDCIAEECHGPDGDGWTPKCRYSTFTRCIARNNGGPGFGMFCRVDGSGDPVDLGEAIDNNSFYACESYGNEGSGFSFNISSTSGEGGSIRNNYIQAICYDNQQSGVRFRNKMLNSIVENNEVDIICFGNRGQNDSGSTSSHAGGLGTEGASDHPVTGITGSVVCFDNNPYDVNTSQATNCNIMVYNPIAENPATLHAGDASNIVSTIGFFCSDTIDAWCVNKYCSNVSEIQPIGPDNLEANALSTSQISLSWTDNANNEYGFKVERKSTGSYTVVGTLAADVTSYLNNFLSTSTEYTYRVRAFNIAGYSAYSNEVTTSTDSINSLTDFISNNNNETGIMNIYPNPTKGLVTVNFASGISDEVILRSISGQKIAKYKPQGNNVFIETENLAPGIYLLTTGKDTMKLMINK